MEETHYDVLGVASTASVDDIKSAHRQKARELHPDKVPDRETDFRRVQKAWECLREPDRRKAYDYDVMHQKMIRESKVSAAIPIKLSEMELAEDDGGQICYFHDCRCGDQIELWPEHLVVGKEAILLECPGCSFGYSVNTTC